VNNAKLGYLRTQNGDHEVDFIIHKGRRIVAIEVKFSPTVTDSDTNHLRWLKKNYPAELMESIVITTGQYVYRREKDGVLVIPAALLGA
jgi:predicted AAA+ superfamily ATPase